MVRAAGTASAPKIVVIGGGTGSFVALSGLKRYTRNLTAIVNMVDDGGSTGTLRDELGVLPPGDVRQCLVALSQSGATMRDLFSYRFEEGSLHGQSFGNLFLSALEKTTGSFVTAVETAGDVLNISGRVVPVTLTDTRLVLHEGGKTTIVGQHTIEDSAFHTPSPKLSLKPKPTLNPDAVAAIRNADAVVIGPGGLYTSLAPALIVPGLATELQRCKAKKLYVANLVTKPGQTDGFKVGDYAREIEHFIGGPILDFVIYNQRRPSQKLLEKYARAGEYAVGFDADALENAHYQAIGGALVSDTMPHFTAAEQLIPRSYIRHDSDKLARLIMDLVA